MHWISGLCLAAVGSIMMLYAGSKKKFHGTKYEIVFAFGLAMLVIGIGVALQDWHIIKFT